MVAPTWTPAAKWNDFKQIIQNQAPRCPIPVQVQTPSGVQAYNTLTQLVDFYNAFADAVDAELPQLPLPLPNGDILQPASPQQRHTQGLQYARDTASGWAMGRALGATGAAIVSNAIDIAVNTFNSLTRASEMEEYLCTMQGYVTTLARVAVESLTTSEICATLPQPQVPRGTRGLYNERRREWFVRGYQLVSRVILRIDTEKPRNEPRHSISCFRSLALREIANLGFSGHRADIERDIYANLLKTNIERVTSQLIRWCRARS
jgi:hypothetical protein